MGDNPFANYDFNSQGYEYSYDPNTAYTYDPN
jgi:hypothetical protein